MTRVLVIIGSVRRHRVGPAIARWVAAIGREVAGDAATFELVDLREWPLAMDAEPGIPQMGEYVEPTTRAWSATVAAADAFVFVSPQYNWGYPAALKNALDHLYREWSGKRALIVTYGGHGGDKAAAQLRQVLEAMKVEPVATMPGLTLPRAMIQANTGEIDPPATFGGAIETLRRGFAELLDG